MHRSPWLSFRDADQNNEFMINRQNIGLLNIGYSNLGNLSNAISRHEKAKSHLSSCLINAAFGQARIDLQLDEQTR